MSGGPIGLIGLGLLGGAVADRLRERGLAVLGFDVDAARRADAAGRGIELADGPAPVAARCEVTILSLPDGTVVDRVLDGIEPHLAPGRTVIDTTTASPEQMQAHAARLQRRGAAFVEAEVAGSSAQLRRGEALLLVAGAAEDVAACREVLDALATRVRYVGPQGAAARLKLVHNLALGLHRAVLAEALVFAEALGLDAEAVLDVLRESPAASAVMTTKGQQMARRDFRPLATVRQHLKDVRLILAAAADRGQTLPLSTLHATLLERAIALGHAESDNTAVIAAFDRP